MNILKKIQPNQEEESLVNAAEALQAQNEFVNAQQPSIDEALLKRDQEIDRANNLDLALRTLSSVTGTKHDNSGVKSILADADRELKRMSEKRELESKDILAREEKEMFDPNSSVSKSYREQLQESLYGVGLHNVADKLENLSAKQVKDLFGNISNRINTKEAKDSRLQVKMAEKEMKSEIKAAKDEAKDYEDAKKESLIFSKLVKDSGINRGKTALSVLDKWTKGEDFGGIGDVTLVYTFIRSLDPDSAVKEGEVDLIMSAQSPLRKWANLPKKLTEGDLADPKLRQQVLTAMKKLQESRESELVNSSKAISARVKNRKLDPDQVFGEYADKVMSPEKLNEKMMLKKSTSWEEE